MCARCLCWCFLFFAWVAVSGGVRLYPCGDAGYQDVEENTNLTFYCDQYTGFVTWRLKIVRGDLNTLSVCNSTCYSTTSPALIVRAISSTNSSLTTSVTSRNPFHAGIKYLCNVEQCGLHVFAPAEVSQPTSPVITRQDSGYTLSVSANITQVYSSRGLYSCVWQLGPSRLTTTPDLSPPAADTNNTANRTGGCDVTLSLPDTSGTYPCSVTVTPGNTQTSCGNVTITRPSPPTISCPSDIIAENTTLTCTCNTANIGQPGGRLRWFTGTGSDINTEVISGDYDVSTLTMTWTVTRGDHGNRKFRCVNNWMMNVTAQSDYTLQSSGNSGSACSCRQFAEDFGAGLGVGLAILMVVLSVLLLFLWRRQWKLPCTGERPNQSANETVGQREPSLETEMSTRVTDTGPYEELKHTDIGLRSEYSVMSNPTPTTSQYTLETDDGYEIPRQRAAVSAAATGR